MASELGSKTTWIGELEIDHDNGVITFTASGVRILRVTHLPEPLPLGVIVDMVALPELTSYGPK
jgi:hypothetical protein